MIKQKENGHFILNENTIFSFLHLSLHIILLYIICVSSLFIDRAYVNPLV